MADLKFRPRWRARVARIGEDTFVVRRGGQDGAYEAEMRSEGVVLDLGRFGCVRSAQEACRVMYDVLGVA